VLARSEANEGIIDSAAADLELAKRSVEIASGAIGTRHWIAEVGIDQSRRISGRQPAIARKTGQHGIALSKRVSGQPSPMTTQRCVDGPEAVVRAENQRERHACVDGDYDVGGFIHRRMESMRPKMTSSVMTVSE